MDFTVGQLHDNLAFSEDPQMSVLGYLCSVVVQFLQRRSSDLPLGVL